MANGATEPLSTLVLWFWRRELEHKNLQKCNSSTLLHHRGHLHHPYILRAIGGFSRDISDKLAVASNHTPGRVLQVLGEYQAKNDNLSEYLALVKDRIAKFDSAEVRHVPRGDNTRADILSKLASTKKKGGNKSVIQEILPRPSIEKPPATLDINAIGDSNCRMTPVYNYLANDILPSDEKEAAAVKRRAYSYVLLDGTLYRRGFSIPLLKCIEEDKVDYILREIHEGINSQHLGGRSLARKALRAGYYWPTMQQDSKEHVKKCDKCQRHADMHLAPPNELKSLSSPWPFAWWGMDILGPFTTGTAQNKYLIVAVDYFTKWVEAEPLAKITAFNILRFFKRDVLARFGIPQVVVTDNGTQFTDKISASSSSRSTQSNASPPSSTPRPTGRPRPRTE
ncbi:hypothetical protein QL285_045607 [Trifolium repens]|nr:hypothetical protein QL285_045607 [Trifolium repens]